jgi:hypothetical protein
MKRCKTERPGLSEFTLGNMYATPGALKAISEAGGHSGQSGHPFRRMRPPGGA